MKNLGNSRVYSHEAGSQENDGVDETHDPFIFSFSINTELLGERQVGSIGTSLVLRGGCGQPMARSGVRFWE